MMKNSVRITAAAVVLLAFVFIAISPWLGLDLNMSPTGRGFMIATALGLMFAMGVWHFWNKPKAARMLPHR